MAIAEIVSRAIALREDARAAKRESNRQRRIAQERMEELRAFCARHGIAVHEITKGTEADGHGPERQAGH